MMAVQEPSDVKVFICYAREDYTFAKRLYDDLVRAGVSPWLDREKLLPGQNWKVEIRQAMENSAYVLVVLSTNSVSKRGYVQKELKKALDILDEFPSSTIYLIPVRVDECEPIDERLQDLHWVNLFPDYKDGLRQILRVLVPDSKPKPSRTWMKMILLVGTLSLLLLVGGFWGPDIIQRFNSDPSPTPKATLTPTMSPTLMPTAIPTVKPPTPTPIPVLKATPVPLLRNKPGIFSEDDIVKMIKEKGFYHIVLNPNRKFSNEFKQQTLYRNKVIIDQTSDLMWQQSGSFYNMTWEDAQEYVEKFNREHYAGFSDWRLPTIEELASLLEPKGQSNKLYINPIFDTKQRWCWSADTSSSSSVAWRVYFDDGYVGWGGLKHGGYVRCVRSLTD